VLVSPSTSRQQANAGPVGLLFVGRLDVFTKGLDILLEAFATTVGMAGCPRLRLTLAGPDWKGGRPRLEARVRELGIEDRVNFTGELAARDVGAVLAASDIYVQLSRHDGFGLSVVDALLAGKPAVLSDAIGTISYPEIASLSHVRIVPPRKEAAARAIRDAAEALPEITSTARSSRAALAEFFSWDRVARLHLDQYNRLMQS